MRQIIQRGGTIVALWALLACTLAASTAEAQARQGAFRLGTDVRALTLMHYPEDGEVRVQAGIFGTDLFLALRPQLVVHGAYQITDAVLIGARVGFGYQELVFGTFNTETGIIGVLPFLEYLFGEGNIRPFIGGEAGFQITFIEEILGSGLDTEALAIAGGLGGVHIFATDGFSISPAVHFDFLYWGGAEWAGYQIVFLASFEGWI